MEEHVLVFGETAKKIVELYKKAHRIVFTYLVFPLAAIVGIVFALFLVSKKTEVVFIESPEIVIRKVSLKERFDKYLEGNTTSSDFEVYILQGQLVTSGNLLQSDNNLVTYKGFVVPRHFLLFRTVPIKPKSYFSGAEYEVKDLELFAQNVVFTPPNKNFTPLQRTQLEVSPDIETSFNPSCLFSANFIEGACGYYVENFLDQLYIYDLSSDYKGLLKVFSALEKDPSSKEKMCKNMEKYILYSNDTNSSIEQIFRDCGPSSLNAYLDLQGFIEIQKQIKDGYISEALYNNDNLNIYKLISLQQIIYNDIIQKRINQRILSSYLAFLQNLLKRDKLDPFYKDFTYRFHTYYLKQKVADPTFITQKEEQDEFLGAINLLNKGSDLMGFTGLFEQVQNKSLLVVEETQDTSASQGIVLNTTEIVKQLDYLPYLQILKKTLSGNIVSLEANLSIQMEDLQISLPVKIVLEIQSTSFVIKEIQIKGYVQLSKVLQNFVSQNIRNLSILYQYLLENMNLYSIDNPELEICDLILKKNPGLDLKMCQENGVMFQKGSAGYPIRYQLVFKNGKLATLKVSDKNYQYYLNQAIEKQNIASYSLPDLVYFVANYQPPQETEEQLAGPNLLLVSEKFQTYLGATPEHIEEKDSKIRVIFTLKGENFLAEFSLEESKIGPIYFNQVVVRQGSTLPVKNFLLFLDEAHKTEINSFVADPVGYIKSINENAYKAYLKYKK